MKRILIISLFLIFALISSAQNILKLSDKKSVHVVCPDKVLYVQSGDNTSIEAETLPELSNIVRVKALHPFEGQTSLTMVCAGRIYSVTVQFGNCDVLTYQLESLPSEKAFPFSGKLMPDESLRGISDQILSSKGKHTRHRGAEKNGIKMEIRNICVKGDALFLKIQVTNHTNMAFDAEAFNFWIADKRQQKATNVQEYQLVPDYTRKEFKRVPARASASEVFAIEKLTIPDKRVLRIELIEKSTGNTGRKLTIELKNRDFRRAEML
jgi:conjugative transposon TraN protein